VRRKTPKLKTWTEVEDCAVSETSDQSATGEESWKMNKLKSETTQLEITPLFLVQMDTEKSRYASALCQLVEE
jgi:hypothetical protein